MQRYIKKYMEFFGYGEQDFIPSEISGARADDIHHLRGRKHEEIEYLVALTRDEHRDCHADPEFNRLVKKKHLEFIKLMKPEYDPR